jgi:hypothetical protein
MQRKFKKKVIEAVETDFIYNLLRQQKAAGLVALSMKKLDKYMQNQGRGQFTFDVFKAAYDSDPRLQELVKNFDEQKIEFKTSEMDDIPQNAKQPSNDQTVSQMAKRATKIG